MVIYKNLSVIYFMIPLDVFRKMPHKKINKLDEQKKTIAEQSEQIPKLREALSKANIVID